ncbi:MAG: PQQ-binding-like beta-propeller repeat protein, partial [Myxococcota bacterium]
MSALHILAPSTRRLHDPLRVAAPLLALVACAVALPACSKRKRRPPPEPYARPQPVGPPLNTPPLHDLTRLSNPPPSAPEVSFGVATRQVACHKTLEDSTGAARAQLTPPLFGSTKEARALWLSACGAERWSVAVDGSLTLAYPTPTHTDSSGAPVDLRVAAYDAKGALRWTFTIDRSRFAETFEANWRGSFLLPVGALLFCGGTTFQQRTHVVCVEEATGKERWRGDLDFWTGILPQSLDGSLVVADMTGLRHHYPFDGVERAYRRLPGPGGQGAFYATDGVRLFFSDNRPEDVYL